MSWKVPLADCQPRCFVERGHQFKIWNYPYKGKGVALSAIQFNWVQWFPSEQAAIAAIQVRFSEVKDATPTN